MSGDTRYIGKTIRIEKRVAEHVRESRDAERHYHRAQWIRGLVRVGRLPLIETLCRVPVDSWQACERFLIAAARYFDFPLTNGTSGGEGMDFSFGADRQRNAARAAQHSRAMWARPGMREIKSLATKEAWADPVRRQSRSAAISEGKKRGWARRKAEGLRRMFEWETA